MSEIYLDCKDVIKIFQQPNDKDTYATLRGVSIKVKGGEFIGIIGQSGVGKTTLLKILVGDLKPSAGTIEINQQKMHKLRKVDIVKLRRSLIGILYQNPQDNVFPDLTVLQNIILPILVSESTEKSKLIYNRAINLLKEFNLDSKINSPVKFLSGGEIQRLALITSLANDPSILILDEPTSLLDFNNARKVIQYLKRMCQKKRKMVIMVTHDWELSKVTDKTYLMRNGQLELIKKKEQNIFLTGG
jgi:ABC-type lipoprotein export system ATPase subunit